MIGKAPRPIAGTLAAALCLAGCNAVVPAIPKPSPKPLRVMSINLCTDQLLLALLPPDRITSVTWLSRDPASSIMAREAARVPVNHGWAEEVIREKPDLVIVSPFATPGLRGMLKRLNYPTLEVGAASNFDDIRRLTRRVAAAVGERARGEELIWKMDSELAALAGAPHRTYRLAAWDRFGFGAGKGTLQGAVFEAAGAVNVADAPPTSGYGKPDTEVLLEAAPPLLVEGSPYAGGPSVGDNIEAHRLVRRYWSSTGRLLIVPQAYYACGAPRVAEAVGMLRKRLQQAAIKADTPLPFDGVRR
ncbi:MAG: ABC transporter substrate-binding protein [Sphingomonas sp.]